MITPVRVSKKPRAVHLPKAVANKMRRRPKVAMRRHDAAGIVPEGRCFVEPVVPKPLVDLVLVRVLKSETGLGALTFHRSSSHEHDQWSTQDRTSATPLPRQHAYGSHTAPYRILTVADLADSCN